MTDYGKDPQVIPYLLYADAGAAMDWLIRAFGFTKRVRDQQDDGTMRHGELLLDNGGVIMVGSPGADFRGPARLGQVTSCSASRSPTWQRTASARRPRAPMCRKSRTGRTARTVTRSMTPRATAGTSASRCSQHRGIYAG